MAANSAGLHDDVPFLEAGVLEAMSTREDCLSLTLFQGFAAEGAVFCLCGGRFFWKIWNDGELGRTSFPRLINALELDRGACKWEISKVNVDGLTGVALILRVVDDVVIFLAAVFVVEVKLVAGEGLHAARA